MTKPSKDGSGKPKKQTPRQTPKASPQKSKREAKKFPEKIEQTLIAIKALRKGEQLLLKESWEKKRQALVLAFEIGRYIHDIEKQYSAGVVKKLADDWHCSIQTVYNYDHLYCGCLFENTITNFPEINREYFQALGSSIRPVDDFFGFAVRLHLLLNPAYKPPTRFGVRKVDPDLVLKIGQLVEDTRRVAIDDLKAEHLLDKWKWEPIEKDGNARFVFPSVETNSDMGGELRKLCGLLLHEVGLLVGNKVGTVQFPDFEGIKDEIYGSRTPNATFKSLTAKLLLHFRDKRRRQIRAFSGTPKTMLKSAKERVVKGKCQEVLLDRSRFPERSIDAVITDPPYSKEFYDAWRAETYVEHDAEKKIKDQVELVGNVARILVERKIIREQFSWFSFCPLDLVHEFLPPILDAFRDVPHIYQVLAWDKMELPKMGGHQFFGRQVEAIIFVNVGNRPQGTKKREDGTDIYLSSSLMPFHVDRKDDDNDFWKPLSILKHLVMLATGISQVSDHKNQTILDPFAGSGSLGVACIQCGREYRLIESHKAQYKECLSSVLEELKKQDDL